MIIHGVLKRGTEKGWTEKIYTWAYIVKGDNKQSIPPPFIRVGRTGERREAEINEEKGV